MDATLVLVDSDAELLRARALVDQLWNSNDPTDVVLEAQAAGLPCVVSDQGGPAELITDGVEGFITRSLDVDDFAEAIRRLATDSELRRQMGDHARQRVQDRNWTNAFRQFWNH